MMTLQTIKTTINVPSVTVSVKTVKNKMGKGFPTFKI
jgi:hypothetical protein